VFAQHGRNGAKLTPIVKASKVSLASAKAEYQTMLTEKISKKRYREVAAARKSDISDKVNGAMLSLADTLPSWPGFREFYEEAFDFLDAKVGVRMSEPIFSAVVLADLAYGCAEGLPEAVALLKEPSATSSSLLRRLSNETLVWFPNAKAHVAANQLLAFHTWF
jgi:hypothetical protein